MLRVANTFGSFLRLKAPCLISFTLRIRVMSDSPDTAQPEQQQVDNIDPELVGSLRGLPKYMDSKKVQQILTQQGIGFTHVKKAPNVEFARIKFPDLESKKKAFAVLTGFEIKGRQLYMQEIPQVYQKRKQQERTDAAAAGADGGATTANDGDGAADATADGEDADADLQHRGKRVKELPRNAADVVTPLWQVPYEQQLDAKREYLETRLRRATHKLREAYGKQQPEWLRSARAEICPLEAVHVSPETTGYRNKCEFSIGWDPQGKRCIGFNLGLFKEGVVAVGAPDDCPNVAPAALRVVHVMQRVVEQSPLEPWSKHTHTGFWRLLMVRTVRSGDVMVLVQVNPDGATPEQIAEAKQSVQRAFAEDGMTVTSLLWQESNNASNVISSEVPIQVLAGSDTIHETLLGLKFRISSTAFFQVNTAATEVLYSLVRDWCAARPDTTVLDMCCGTGTIGLTMAHSVPKVVGIEMVKSAVDDARVNATLNGVTNVEFVCGKAEDVSAGVMRRLSTKECIAVVDPPRAGLHNKVCEVLRNTPAIQRLVYVSCNADAFVDNAVALCRPVSRKFTGAPFRPVRAAGVDLFPHTGMCELVVLMERQQPQQPTAAAGAAADAGADAAAAVSAEMAVVSRDGAQQEQDEAAAAQPADNTAAMQQ